MLNLIDHLPRDSAFSEHLLDDDEIAERFIDEDLPVRGDRVSEWSSVREGLARIEDAISLLSATTVAVNGGKPPQVVPATRPDTAIQRVHARRRRERHGAIAAKVLPKEA